MLTLPLVITFGIFFFSQVEAVIHSLRNNDDKVHQELHSLADIPTHHIGNINLINRELQGEKKNRARIQKGSKKSSFSHKNKEKKSPKSLEKDSEGDGDSEDCDSESVVLADYKQWQEEEGYWIGDYSFYKSDGTPFTSTNWNYRYNSYKGFITGNIKGNAYRQRNVFLYPPQFSDVCAERGDQVWGEGSCGKNGNSKIFAADQKATTCSTNPEKGGDISGPFQGVFDTTTELVGAGNALLYQVYLMGNLFQSQLTTLTSDADGKVHRTRSAQGFAGGLPRYQSFYRERKVDREEFYATMISTLAEYDVLKSDTCTWIDNPARNPPVIDTGLQPGITGCETHLEESFDL